LTPETRRRVSDIFIAIWRRDAERLGDRLIEVTAPTDPVDRNLITNEINRMLELYVDVSLENVRFGHAMEELLQLVQRHRLRLPGSLVLFFKALAMCEGVLRVIDPDSSFLDYLQPMLRKMVYREFAGREGLGRLRDSALEAAELTIELPRRLDRLLGDLERGNLRVWTRIDDAEPLMKRLERIVERANATILAAACIVALAVVMLFYHPQGWQVWIGLVFWIAFTAAVVESLRTLWALRK
jgi:ubiquinone biosynthesis protein